MSTLLTYREMFARSLASAFSVSAQEQIPEQPAYPYRDYPVMRARKDVLDKAAWAWAESTDPSDVSKEHIFKAYRIDLPECGIASCKRNCRGSPRCLSALGEIRWISDEGKDGCEDTDDDPNSEKRDSGSFLGLKNLGATCYVNSLLQLWFHNLPFRKAIYEWDPTDDPEERECLQLDESKYPVTAVGRLQVLFANLQFGIRRYIDPSDFIHSLGIDTTQQQDAQEFSKLFISMLEDRLAFQTKPSVHDMISKNFQGEYSYVTKCSGCLTESDTVAKFYELDLNIQGHKTLGDSLAEFLHEEKLDGANRYYCGGCGCKQDATRCIHLRSLPPVLHLQLLRFVYDRSKGHKKKLSSPIQFPEVLDMSEYVGRTAGSVVYNLGAILAHMGTSAHSGHYVANIKDSITGVWHKFNDEAVDEDGKKLSLGAEDDAFDGSSKGKGRGSKPIKGQLTSRNAYMLVYSLASKEGSHGSSQEISTCVNGRQGVNGSISKGVAAEVTSDSLYAEMISWGLEQRLRDKVHDHNRQFEEWAISEIQKKEISKVQNEALKMEMSKICQDLCIGRNNRGMDFISLVWLQKFLAKGIGDDTAVGPISNKDEICPHGSVHPSRVTNMKIINSNVADILYKHFSGGPRVKVPESLCKECVVNRCREIRLKNQMVSDTKEMSVLLKSCKEETGPGFWVGRVSFKNWKTLVFKSVPDDGCKDKTKNYEMEVSSSGDLISDEHETSEFKCERTNVDAVDDINERSSGLKERKPSSSHTQKKRGGTSRRKAVTSKLTAKKICLSSQENGNCNTEEPSSSVDQEDEPMSLESNNIPEDNMGQEPVSSPIDMKEDKDLLNKEQPSESTEDQYSDFEFNGDIICEHGNLDIDEAKRRLVIPAIWNIFKKYFPSAKEFPRDASVCSMCQESASEGEAAKEYQRKIAQKQKEALADLFSGKKRPVPPFQRRGKTSNGCQTEDKEVYYLVSEGFITDWRKFISCRGEAPLCVRGEDLLCAHGGLLFHPLCLFQEDVDERHVVVHPHEWNDLKNFYSVDHEVSMVFDTASGELRCSPEVCTECEQSRARALRMRLCTYRSAKIFVRRVAPEDKEVVCPLLSDPMDPEFSPQGVAAAAESLAGAGIRRSERSRKPRGDSKELTVSSAQTLQQLKRQICKVFSVMPVDQHLTLNGQPLEGPDLTLGDLNIVPNSQILLRADEPAEGVSILDDYVKDGAIEEGFKGTGLLSR